jgi:hypothetical protein
LRTLDVEAGLVAAARRAALREAAATTDFTVLIATPDRSVAVPLTDAKALACIAHSMVNG